MGIDATSGWGGWSSGAYETYLKGLEDSVTRQMEKDNQKMVEEMHRERAMLEGSE